VPDLAFEREVRLHSSDRRRDCSQEVQESGGRFGREHRSLEVDGEFEGKIGTAEAVCKPAGSVSKSRHC
jgi:hypothetical protein